MIVLKAQRITTGERDLETFVIKNNIKKEDIINITASGDAISITYTIFYYADSETKVITRGFLGWD